MSLQFKITFNKYIKKVMYYESKAEFSVAITTVFSDKQSFRNHLKCLLYSVLYCTNIFSDNLKYA